MAYQWLCFFSSAAVLDCSCWFLNSIIYGEKRLIYKNAQRKTSPKRKSAIPKNAATPNDKAITIVVSRVVSFGVGQFTLFNSCRDSAKKAINLLNINEIEPFELIPTRNILNQMRWRCQFQ